MSEENKTYSEFNDYLRNLIQNAPKDFPEEKTDTGEDEVIISDDDKEEFIDESDSSEKENIDVDGLVESENGGSDSSVDINSVLGGSNPVFEDEDENVEDENTEDENYEVSTDDIENQDEGQTSETVKSDVVDEYMGDSVEDDSDDDNQYFDPLEEQLLYSSDDDSVSFDDLNNDEEDEDSDEDDSSVPTDKKNFSEVHGSKGKYMAGKSKKSLILAILIGVFAVLLISLEVRKIAGERKNIKDRNSNSDSVNTGGYNPDFGDYASRAHVTDSRDQNVSDTNYAEALLSTNDRSEFQKEEIPKYTQSNQNYSSGSSAPPSSSWTDAVESSIRYQGFNGSGPGNYIEGLMGKNGVNDIYAGYGNYGGYYDPASEYLNGYSQILNGLTGSNYGAQVSNENISKRNFNNGSYDRNAQSSMTTIAENSLYPGTVIHAVLVSGINTDYPGAITARVLNNVYDSKTGKNLLIPSGSILRGSYSSASIGINRIQIAWTELILNRDGKDYYVNLGSMIGIDRQGYSGIKGTLNDHAFSYAKAMGLSAMFTLLNSNVYKVTNSQKSQTRRQLIAESQDIANTLTEKILDRALDIEPTVTVKPGTKISVDVDKILTLVPYSRDIPKERYVRKK